MASGLPQPGDLKFESQIITDLRVSKDELLERVQTLKNELGDWRGKLDEQMNTYRNELGELRKSLNSEVDLLRSEFQELRATLKQQLDVTSKLATQEGSKITKAAAATAGMEP